MASSTPTLDNIQGLIVRPFTHPYARHLLLQINDAADGRALLKALSSLVTSAGHWGDVKPPELLNLSLTCNGLKALNVDPLNLDGGGEWGNRFPEEFVKSDGVNPDFTAQPGNPEQPGQAGFAGNSDPAHWWQGGTPEFTSAKIHLILHLYVLEAPQLNVFTSRIRELLPASIIELRPMIGGETLDSFRIENGGVHFGYRDGISQPVVNWPGMDVTAPDSDFRDFILGYADDVHQSAPRGDFAADGSYLVFQVIHQDCASFNRLLRQGAAALAGKIPAGVADAEAWIAAKLLGRWGGGAPLANSPLKDAPELKLDNEIDYGHDADGRKCPFSAHVRVANPRQQEVNELSQPVPRIIRRGAPYGPPLTGEVDDDVDRGLIGMFIGASILRQYLKIMKWIHRNDFSGVFVDATEQDPIQGNRTIPQTSGKFRIPDAGGDLALEGVPPLVKTRGAAFCFMPSLSTIQKLGDGGWTKAT
jgi:Dyp-type peroxidase family